MGETVYYFRIAALATVSYPQADMNEESKFPQCRYEHVRTDVCRIWEIPQIFPLSYTLIHKLFLKAFYYHFLLFMCFKVF